MPSVRDSLAALSVAGLLTFSGCSGGSPLAGTTWKGGNMFDSNVQLSFGSSSDCQLKSIVGSGPCTYSVSGKQVSVTFKGTSYVFAMDGDAMAGNLMGAGVALAKQ